MVKRCSRDLQGFVHVQDSGRREAGERRLWQPESGAGGGGGVGGVEAVLEAYLWGMGKHCRIYICANRMRTRMRWYLRVGEVVRGH